LGGEQKRNKKYFIVDLGDKIVISQPLPCPGIFCLKLKQQQQNNQTDETHGWNKTIQIKMSLLFKTCEYCK
jgi:hypothetical protein